MRIVLAAVTARRQGLRPGPARELFHSYVSRIKQYAEVELSFLETEAALLEKVQRHAGRVPSKLVLLDSRGKDLSSEGFAMKLGAMQEGAVQQAVFAVGPASGWSATALRHSEWLLSFGALTFPREIALVLLAEQVYRAQTILAGHPYHSGH